MPKVTFVIKLLLLMSQYSFDSSVSFQPNYNDKFYFGVPEKSFKNRFYNQTKSFIYEDYTNDTKLWKE